MDLSTIIDALAKATEHLHMKSTNVSLDRTLGSLASITLTLGLYRVLRSAGGKISNSGVLDLVKICLASLLIGDGVKRMKGDRELSVDNDAFVADGCEKRLTGSCHCKSVTFVLKARRKVEAKDCDGKIRYPHYTTNANDFQLVSGARYLSVYYVNLAAETKGHAIAAHTFCSKCGVHILRAPNSNSDRLEVNTNCLDDKSGVKEIRVEGDLSGMSLSSGRAMESHNIRSPRPTSIDEDNEEDSLWMQDDDFLQSMSMDRSKLMDQIGPNTPGTLASSTLLQSGGSTSALSTTSSSIVDDYDDVSTLHSKSTINSQHYNTRNSGMSVNGVGSDNSNSNHYNPRNTSQSVSGVESYYKSRNGMNMSSMKRDDSDAASTRTWAVSRDNHTNKPSAASVVASDGSISLPGMPPPPFEKRPHVVNNKIPPPSALMNEQLQYYMKKHLASTKSEDSLLSPKAERETRDTKEEINN